MDSSTSPNLGEDELAHSQQNNKLTTEEVKRAAASSEINKAPDGIAVKLSEVFVPIPASNIY